MRKYLVVYSSLFFPLILGCASTSTSDPSTGQPHGRISAYTDQNPIVVRPIRNLTRGGPTYEILFKVIVKNTGLLPVEIRTMTVELIDPSRGTVARKRIDPDDAAGISGISGSGTIEPGSSAKIPIDMSEDVTDVRLMSRAMIQITIEAVDEAGKALTATTSASLSTGSSSP